MKTKFLRGITLTLILSAVGCISPAVHTSVPKFADAVTLTAHNSKGAFAVVEQKFTAAEVENLVLNYDQQGFDPGKVHHFLAPEDLQVRLELLDALQQYASTLAEVSSDSTLQQFDSETQAFGSSVRNLNSRPAFQKLVRLSGKDINVATTAIDALGRWFVDRKRQRDLLKLIEQMQDPVQQTAQLLKADIGNRPDQNGRGGNGLRLEAWDAYNQLMLDLDRYIRDRDNTHQIDPAHKERLIRRLPQLVDEQIKTDNALQQTAEGFSALVDAHNEILRAVQTKADLHTSISTLIAEGLRIKEFYESLQK